MKFRSCSAAHTQASWIAKSWIATRKFNAIVRNEAEATICDIVDALGGQGDIAKVAGVTYRRRGGVARTEGAGPLLDLDSLPFPAYDAYPIRELGLTTLRVDAGRGCPFGCTFCSTASFFGRRYRLKSAERLVSELDRLAAEYGIRHFGLTHDLFTVDKRKVREFCDAVASRGYTWSCSARMDCVDEALLTQMRAAGCTSVYYGVETGSVRLQPLVGKHLDLSLYDPTVETSLRLGMDTTVSFITGYPNETVEDQDATLNLAGDSINRYPDGLSVQLHLLTPEPVTALHIQHLDSLAYDGHITDFNFPTLESDDAEIMESNPSVFVCHHYFAEGLDRAENIAVSNGYRMLYGLGHEFLGAMQQGYEGPFSALVRDFGRSASSFGDAIPGALGSFFSERFGSDHAFTDIVKYRIAITRLRADDSERLVTIEPGTPIRLAQCIVPIDWSRDGGQLLRQLREGVMPDEPALTPSWHLLVASPDLTSCGSFRIDRLTFELATSLQQTTTREDLETHFNAKDLESRLCSLCLIGAIVRDSGGLGSESEPLPPPVIALRR